MAPGPAPRTADGAVPKVLEPPTLPWPPARLPAVTPRSREAELGQALQAGALMADDSFCPGLPTGGASVGSPVSKRGQRTFPSR